MKVFRFIVYADQTGLKVERTLMAATTPVPELNQVFKSEIAEPNYQFAAEFYVKENAPTMHLVKAAKNLVVFRIQLQIDYLETLKAATLNRS